MNQQNDISIIVKEAAGAKTWLREKLSPSSWIRGIGEGLIGDYKEKMNLLRYVDDRIFEWMEDVDDRYKQMQAALKGNRFVDLALLLADFNNRLKKIEIAGKHVKKLNEKALEEFEENNEYAKQFTPEGIEDTFKADDGIVSEAGYFSDLKRKYVMKKLQGEERKKRFLALSKFLADLKTLILRVKESLNLMSKARASGEIGQYIDRLKVVEKEQNNFEKMFFPIYNTYLKSIVDRVVEKEKQRNKENEKVVEETKPILQQPQEQSPEQQIPETVQKSKSEYIEPQSKLDPEEQSPQTQRKEPVPEAFIQNIPDLTKDEMHQAEFENSVKTDIDLDQPEQKKPKPTTKKSKQKKDLTPTPTPEFQTPLDKRIIKSPADLKPEENEVEKATKKAKNLKFIHELVKTSTTDNPILITKMLLKYAEDIEETQPNQSIALINLVNEILG